MPPAEGLPVIWIVGVDAGAGGMRRFVVGLKSHGPTTHRVDFSPTESAERSTFTPFTCVVDGGILP